uniref:Uncharacterized protein n=1 Tax=Glossina pallidipes TaxID=7398 RepID=A0A1B0A331_GLOPL
MTLTLVYMKAGISQRRQTFAAGNVIDAPNLGRCKYQKRESESLCYHMQTVLIRSLLELTLPTYPRGISFSCSKNNHLNWLHTQVVKSPHYNLTTTAAQNSGRSYCHIAKEAKLCIEHTIQLCMMTRARLLACLPACLTGVGECQIFQCTLKHRIEQCNVMQKL